MDKELDRISESTIADMSFKMSKELPYELKLRALGGGIFMTDLVKNLWRFTWKITRYNPST
ncbi:hypothetical protein EN833_18790 [Mesorhizobium sp. M4B.F.Ca.ET.190.01.1.1]|uniref:hypothetical protein n=1 Tax=unclassified Mesorhizobium TaxID=325217 RepID=UPI0010923554|nr:MULTISPECIES: hypothetical protein [unclassified Mesorhizobium]TGR08203.1 hypothetical protein EN843_18780 [Mesorhizobium sp. M4B.F.Ca.ET.200.01.1.1]TGS17560.1 hypothetical protein EN833_18790 [Mesorhizobium sp. M4B.F.Ca.ET.190.01.1.1]TGT29884.1 hypothetical protein EN815_18765 [Mesorhizobium sp. M4B.F.Ca.ET.172.01.1.1]